MKHLWRAVAITVVGLFLVRVALAQTPTPSTQTEQIIPCPAEWQSVCEAFSSYGWLGLVGLAFVALAFAYFSGWFERLKKRGEEDAAEVIPVRVKPPPDSFNAVTQAYLEIFDKFYSRFSFRGLEDVSGGKMPTFDNAFVSLQLSSSEYDHTKVNKGQHEGGATKVTLTEAVKRATRLMVVGAAGSGKSTLLQWAGVTAARAQLPGQLTAEQKAFIEIIGQPLPVFLSLRDFVKYCRRPEARRAISPSALTEFCLHFYHEQFSSIEFPPDFFERHLKNACLLLLDGVDEVALEDRVEVRNAVEGFVANYGVTRVRYLLSSRAVAYSGQVEFAEFGRLDVQPLSDEQRDELARFWCSAIYSLPEEATHNALELIQSINRSDGRVRDLARTPLMVAIFVLVYYHNNKQLPKQRAEFYHHAVHILVRETHHANVSEYPLWAELPAESRIAYIERIAWELYTRKLGDATVEELIDWVGDEFSRDTTHVRAFLNAAVNRSGVLEERGGQIGFFTHRTFQEYLTGLYLAQKLENRWAVELKDHFLDDTWWEVLQLAAGALAYLAPSKANNFIYILSNLGRTDSEKAIALERAALAQANFPLNRAQENQETLIRRCSEDMAKMALPQSTRRALGLALGKLGDPRFKPSSDRNQFIPPVWRTIPGGQSRNGVNDVDAQTIKQTIKYGPYPFEKPAHVITLSEFSLAKHPVSNAEYALFVNSGDYMNQMYWGLDGWRWLLGEYDSEFRDGNSGALPSWLLHRPIEKRRQPAFWDDSNLNATNLPVVGVTWFEARAYCNWLSEKLREQLPTGWYVRLPTEAEWEKACRRAKLGDSQLKVDAIWPWGNLWLEDRCNTDESNIGSTTPLGMYPLGMSADGVEDLIGNVCEWCLDGRDEQTYATRNGAQEPFRAQGNERVLRGGCFRYDRWDSYGTKRNWNLPAIFSDIYGFRVCASPVLHVVSPEDHN